MATAKICDDAVLDATVSRRRNDIRTAGISLEKKAAPQAGPLLPSWPLADDDSRATVMALVLVLVLVPAVVMATIPVLGLLLLERRNNAQQDLAFRIFS
jgi:hypothetical protein